MEGEAYPCQPGVGWLHIWEAQTVLVESDGVAGLEGAGAGHAVVSELFGARAVGEKDLHEVAGVVIVTGRQRQRSVRQV